MNARALQTSPEEPEPIRPVQDGWSGAAGGSTLPAAVTPTPHCAVCNEPLGPNARHCPRCLREVPDRTGARTGDRTSHSHDVPPTDAPSSTRPQAGAVYTLEFPAQCPECEREIRTLRVIRVLRTQVSFTSTLPRRGYVILCPECDRMLSAELSGLI